MKVELKQYETGSFVSLYDGLGKLYGSILYDRKIHRYESESAYLSLVTQDKTYGDNATIELFDYFKSKQPA